MNHSRRTVLRKHLPKYRLQKPRRGNKAVDGYIADHHDNLLPTLNEKQKEALEKFDDCYNELIDINERELFTYAFKLGAKIALEILYETQ